MSLASLLTMLCLLKLKASTIAFAELCKAFGVLHKTKVYVKYLTPDKREKEKEKHFSFLLFKNKLKGGGGQQR